MAKSSNIVLAFLSGAAIGAGVGLLYAPEKGEETRKRLSNEAGKAKDVVKEQWDKTSGNISKTTKKKLSEFEEKLDSALSSASYKADDIIVSLQKRLDELREQNKKLQKAKKSATKAKTNA